MRLFQNIRAKMIVFSIATSFLFLLIAALGIIGINRITRSADIMYTDCIPIINSIHAANFALLDGHELMHHVMQDVKNPEDVDTDQEDHIYDEFRYACMARPIIPKRVKQIPSGTFAAERNRYLKAKQYAIRHGVSLQAAYSRVR